MYWLLGIFGVIAFCVHCANDPVNTAGSTKPRSRKKHRDNRGPYVASDGRVYDKKETPSRVSPALEGVFGDEGFQNQKVKVK